MRQKTIRVFEVDDVENLVKVVESKYELIKNYFFLLKKRNKKIEEYLKLKNLSFFIINDEGFTYNKDFLSRKIKEIVVEKEIIKENKTLIFDRIIRSGEEIDSKNNLIFLNRINAGAKIKSSGNIEIYGECEGMIECEGDYLIVKRNKKGLIFFKGVEIKEVNKLTIFTEKFKKVLE